MHHPAADNYPNVFKEDESSNGAKGPGSGGESANAVAERVRSVVKVGCSLSWHNTGEPGLLL